MLKLDCCLAQEDPGKGTLPGVIGWVLRHRRALIITYLVRSILTADVAKPTAKISRKCMAVHVRAGSL